MELFLELNSMTSAAAEAQKRILNVIGGQYVERWPEYTRALFFGISKLKYGERLHIAKFLYGNLRDEQLVYTVMRHDAVGVLEAAAGAVGVLDAAAVPAAAKPCTRTA